MEFRVEDGALVELSSGGAERRWRLDTLKRAELRRIASGPAIRNHVLVLSFAGGRTALSSLSYAGFGPPHDQTRAFAPFARALLAETAAAAPGAAYERGASPLAAVLLWAMALIGAGALVILAVSVASGSPALGIDLSARLVFVLLVLASAWTWVANSRRRAFDPKAIPQEVLPLP